MAAFVLLELGQPARRAMFETPPVRVGRDADNDLVLKDETVSREHAVFVQDDEGRWVVTCISQKNPIVVDGAVVASGATLSEGSEIAIGSRHLIIWSANEITAKAYTGGAFLTHSQCGRCQWTGLVSTLRRVAACPRCGSATLTPLDEYQADAPHSRGDHTTAQMSDDQAAAFFRKMKVAKRSFLLRDDAHDPEGSKRQLEEQGSVALGGEAPGALRLAGIVFGSAQLRWDGTSYVVESALKFPAMKVNGEKTERARLRHGDVVEIGSNRFRFTTE